MTLALLIALAAAQSAPPTAAPTPAKPQLICRKSEHKTGSRIRTGKQCRTAEQWAVEDAARDRKPADMRVTEGQDRGNGPAQ